MTTTRNLGVEVALHGQSAQAQYCDRHPFERLGAWRDFFPRDRGERLNAKVVKGERQPRNHTETHGM